MSANSPQKDGERVELTGEHTRNPVQTRRLVAKVDVGRIGWHRKPPRMNPFPALKYCCAITSADLAGAIVITNAWRKSRAVQKAKEVWFDHVRFVTEDDESTIFCEWMQRSGAALSQHTTSEGGPK